MQDQGWRDRVVRYRADPELSREQAAARASAFVYGNVLVFAATVPLSPDMLHHGHAALLILGAVASTFLAHVFSDVVGYNVRVGRALTRTGVWHEMRDALPIVTSGFVPILLFLASSAGWLPERAAILSAEIYLLLRMALSGLLIERLQSERSSVRTLVAGIALAGAAAAVSLVKVAIGH